MRIQSRTNITQAYARALEPHLVLLVLAPNGIAEFELPRLGTWIVGREPSSNVWIDDGSVSRTHARLSHGPDGPIVADLGSTNGTFVNEKRVGAEDVPLKPDDVIRFGNITTQLHLMPARRPEMACTLAASAFDVRVCQEAERALRFNRCAAVVAVECLGKAYAEGARAVVAESLRSVDLLTARGTSRLDILLTECTKSSAHEMAGGVLAALSQRGIEARLGVGVFPGDSPSPQRLLLAAHVAMLAAAPNQVSLAKEAARVFQVGKLEVIVAEQAMARLFGTIERIASLPMPVLVTGETGTGKEIIAEALHALGNRASRPLVKLNCAAFTETLLEGELFGYEKGAFSGAFASKPGLFEAAADGTLFLDEIGEMSPSLQSKLLRVLEDRRVRRLGALKDREIDVRIVAATHRDIGEAAQQGRFRADLYYRISGMVLKVPPLRERRREIRPLAERFAADAARVAGREPIVLTGPVIAALENYAWPGNIRELRNVVGAAVVAASGVEIEFAHLPPELTNAALPGSSTRPQQRPVTVHGAQIQVSLEEELRAVERARIVEALEICAGNQTKAAELLQMPRRTFVAKLTSLGIDRQRKP